MILLCDIHPSFSILKYYNERINGSDIHTRYECLIEKLAISMHNLVQIREFIVRISVECCNDSASVT